MIFSPVSLLCAPFIWSKSILDNKMNEWICYFLLGREKFSILNAFKENKRVMKSLFLLLKQQQQNISSFSWWWRGKKLYKRERIFLFSARSIKKEHKRVVNKKTWTIKNSYVLSLKNFLFFYTFFILRDVHNH